MLRIGEFSALSTISINMLRHYDKIGLLMPWHIDSVSGYRYYDKEQLIWSNKIVSLKEMGFSLEEIKEISTIKQSKIEEFLHHKLNDKKVELKRIECQIDRINEVMQKHGEEEEYAISIVTKCVPSMWIVSLRDRIRSFPEEGLLWTALMKECEEQRIIVTNNAIAMAINHETNREINELDVEVQLSIEKKHLCNGRIKIYQLPERKVASLIYQGSYNKISSINSFVAKWIENNEYQITSKPYSIYHNSPREDKLEQNFVTELCFPISKKND